VNAIQAGVDWGALRGIQRKEGRPVQEKLGRVCWRDWRTDTFGHFASLPLEEAVQNAGGSANLSSYVEYWAEPVGILTPPRIDHLPAWNVRWVDNKGLVHRSSRMTLADAAAFAMTSVSDKYSPHLEHQSVVIPDPPVPVSGTKLLARIAELERVLASTQSRNLELASNLDGAENAIRLYQGHISDLTSKLVDANTRAEEHAKNKDIAREERNAAISNLAVEVDRRRKTEEALAKATNSYNWFVHWRRKDGSVHKSTCSYLFSDAAAQLSLWLANDGEFDYWMQPGGTEPALKNGNGPVRWRLHWREKKMAEFGASCFPAHASLGEAQRSQKLYERHSPDYDYWLQPEPAPVDPKVEPKSDAMYLVSFSRHIGHGSFGTILVNQSPESVREQLASVPISAGDVAIHISKQETPKPYEPKWKYEHTTGFYDGSGIATQFSRVDADSLLGKRYLWTAKYKDADQALTDASRWINMDAETRDKRLDELYAAQLK